MLRWILQKSKIITLLCYSVYALSPVYATLPASNKLSGQGYHLELGILWLNIVLDSFADEERTDGAISSGDLSIQTAENADLVVIQKKRVVSGKVYVVQPLLKARTVAISELEPPPPVATAYDIHRDVIHRHADGYCSLSTGLSPPSFLS